MTEEIFTKAIATFGIENQMRQLQEECAELIVAVNKISRYPDDTSVRDNFLEECEDVRIMLDQMALIFGRDIGIRERKLERLKERLDNV